MLEFPGTALKSGCINIPPTVRPRERRADSIDEVEGNEGE